MSALTNRYGCRTISMAGTTLAAVGYLLSTFALNVSTLYLTIGVMAGKAIAMGIAVRTAARTEVRIVVRTAA